ncbi:MULTISPECIES: mechanosensitive ion channel family protein [unclassified Halobacteriovorax]|uniref:mechanosensitive ion channel family protein n=1 Tax=unclassified Halobacteriovorax TaxID=2639665 RepID=UPI002FF23BEC
MNKALKDTIQSSEKVASLFSSISSEVILSIFFGFLFLYLFAKTLNWALEYLAIKIPSYRLSILQFNTIATHITYIVGSLWILYVAINPSKEMVYAIMGSGAVAIGFSLKDLVSSIIAGIILIFDRPFQVGDRISFRDNYGDIIRIGLRSVRIRTLEDSVVTIPNNLFLSENVSSANSGERDMMVCSDYYFKNNVDLNQVLPILDEVTRTSRFAYLNKPVKIITSSEKFEEIVGLKITVKAYVLETKYEKDFTTDITKRFYQGLRDESLEDSLISSTSS